MTATATASNHTRLSILSPFILKEEFRFSWAIMTLLPWEMSLHTEIGKETRVVSTNYYFVNFCSCYQKVTLLLATHCWILFVRLTVRKSFDILKRLEAKTVFNGSQLAKNEKEYSWHVPAIKIYRDEADGLKSCKYTWKITILIVKMWNMGAKSWKFDIFSITA